MEQKIFELEKMKADAESRAANLSASLEQQQNLLKIFESQKQKIETEKNLMKTEKEKVEKILVTKGKEILRLETEFNKQTAQLIAKDSELLQMAAEIQRLKVKKFLFFGLFDFCNIFIMFEPWSGERAPLAPLHPHPSTPIPRTPSRSPLN